MKRRNDYNRKVDRAIIGAMRSLQFIASDLETIAQAIRDRGEGDMIMFAMIKSRADKRQRQMKYCPNTCSCDICQADFIGMRLRSIVNDQRQRTILSTGGKRSQRYYVYIEGLEYESTRDGGMITRLDAIEKIQAITQYRKSQTDRLFAQHKALQAVIRQLRNENYHAQRPAIYDEIQDDLFSVA